MFIMDDVNSHENLLILECNVNRINLEMTLWWFKRFWKDMNWEKTFMLCQRSHSQHEKLQTKNKGHRCRKTFYNVWNFVIKILWSQNTFFKLRIHSFSPFMSNLNSWRKNSLIKWFTSITFHSCKDEVIPLAWKTQFRFDSIFFISFFPNGRFVRFSISMKRDENKFSKQFAMQNLGKIGQSDQLLMIWVAPFTMRLKLFPISIRFTLSENLLELGSVWWFFCACRNIKFNKASHSRLPRSSLVDLKLSFLPILTHPRARREKAEVMFRLN